MLAVPNTPKTLSTPAGSAGGTPPPSPGSSSSLRSPADDYVTTIYKHSLRTIDKCSVPGSNYQDLSGWLTRTPPTSDKCPGDEHLAILHEFGRKTPGSPQTFCERELGRIDALAEPKNGNGHILFIRGFLSREWAAAIGSKYALDPEFLHRHLDFFVTLEHCHAFALPSLRSTSSNIIQLCVNTILVSGPPPTSHVDAKARARERLKHASQLATHHRQLQQLSRCGDSIVRQYAALDGYYSVIEQRITICVERGREGWTCLVWMDHGKDLLSSPSGPWSEPLRNRGNLLPVVQHYRKMTTRNIESSFTKGPAPNVPALNGPALPSGPPRPNRPPPPPPQTSNSTKSAPQSTSLLPLDYDSVMSLVNSSKSPINDALPALIPLFTHAAFSEVQFLNLMEIQINREASQAANHNDVVPSIDTLEFYAATVDRHTRQITHTLDALHNLARGYKPQRRSRSSLTAPGREDQDQSDSCQDGRSGNNSRSRGRPALSVADRGPDNNSSSNNNNTKGHALSAPLVADYEDLLARCIGLRERCSAGMSVVMNQAAVLESRRAIEQAERTKRLTVLAALFIPLSFAASLFGMNLKVFGQGELAIWWFVVIAAPLTGLAYAVYVLDFGAFWKGVVEWCQRCVRKLLG